ncbi:MAG TPA: Crp/Fnr family transcriptional regulator [Aestuariivirga sp.]|nr:Crp/Fnr family transcriptional regulator [Aestuariivirga sp.]
MVETRPVSGNGQPPPDETLADIIRTLFPRESLTTTPFRARSYVFHQGSPVGHVYLITRGMMVLERIDESGRMAMFGTHGPGSLLGWQDLMNGRIHRSSGEAIAHCDVVMIAAEAFEAVLRESEVLLIKLMQQAAVQASSYEEHIFRLSTLDVPDRLYHTLLHLAGDAKPDGATLEVDTPFMKRDIAALAGTTPETLSRGLRRLSKLRMAEFTEKNRFRIVVPKNDED